MSLLEQPTQSRIDSPNKPLNCLAKMHTGQQRTIFKDILTKISLIDEQKVGSQVSSRRHLFQGHPAKEKSAHLAITPSDVNQVQRESSSEIHICC